jgi:hypothetical protein
MKRPAKIELAPVFGEKAGRKATPIKATELKGRNQDFESTLQRREASLYSQPLKTLSSRSSLSQ